MLKLKSLELALGGELHFKACTRLSDSEVIQAVKRCDDAGHGLMSNAKVLEGTTNGLPAFKLT